MPDTDINLWPLVTKFFSLQHDLKDLIAQREPLFSAPLDFPRLKSYFQDLEVLTARLKKSLQEIEKIAPLNSAAWAVLQQETFQGTINQTYPLLKDVNERNR